MCKLLDMFSKKPEKKYYYVSSKEMTVHDLTDEQWKEIAERNGAVLTEKEFKEHGGEDYFQEMYWRKL